jgi:CRP-like cAMP-binding protein
VESVESYAFANSLLGRLPQAELGSLRTHMEKTFILPKQILYQAGRLDEFIYFPVTAVLSMMVSTLEGQTVEVATVGNEGVAGLLAILGDPQISQQAAPIRIVTQIPGNVIRLPAEKFRQVVERNAEVNRVVQTYGCALCIQLALASGCNRLHSLEQRCAKWLLTCTDRIQYEEVAVTQEMLAEMLGAHRQSVLQVLGELESREVIGCSRGSIKIRDHKRLSGICCECYRIQRDHIQHFTSTIK